jgi:hypothetical protein
VAPPEPAIGVVRIEIGVDVAVVRAVAPSPPSDGTLGCTGTCQGEEYLKGRGSIVGTVRPKAVVSRRDT